VNATPTKTTIKRAIGAIFAFLLLSALLSAVLVIAAIVAVWSLT
jgi:hypothetical protein